MREIKCHNKMSKFGIWYNRMAPKGGIGIVLFIPLIILMILGVLKLTDTITNIWFFTSFILMMIDALLHWDKVVEK